MKTHVRTKIAALAAASVLAIGGVVGITDDDAAARELRRVDKTTHTVVVAMPDTLVFGGGGGGGGFGASDKVAAPGDHTLSDQYCDDDLVDDDIVECDIGEIAYVCPDGKAPSSGECSNAMGSEFP